MAVDSINAINALYLDQSSGALQKASQGTEQKAQTSAGEIGRASCRERV